MIFKFSKNYFLLISLVSITILLGEATIYFLDLNKTLYKNLSEQLTLEQIESYFAIQKRWSWVKYALLPLIIWLKTNLISWILAIGGFFQSIELPHKKYWNIVLKAEFVNLSMGLTKLLWFMLVEPDFDLEKLQQFVPFSLENILYTEHIPKWGIYPLQLINVFEIFYWILLILLLNKVTKTRKGLIVVVTSYGLALFIWMIFIMFLTLNAS